jgi:hypothetical protein
VNIAAGASWAEYTAIYAAALSTIVFAWQMFIYFRTGPRQKVFAASGRKLFGPTFDSRDYLVVEVTNRGTADTTLTLVVVKAYDLFWGRLRKPREQKILGRSVRDHVPFVLSPGHTFLAP